MKKYYLLFLLLFSYELSNSQSFNWANSFGSTGVDQGYPIKSDAANNSYISGRFEGNVDFDPSSSTTSLQSNGGYDIFLAKYDENGHLIWSKGIGGSTSADFGRGIALDDSSNIYLTGTFGGTVDFDPGSGVTNLTATNTDAFLAKYDSSGAFIWVVQFGGAGNEEGWSLSSDGSNNIYVSGYFSSALSYSKNGITSTLNSSGSYDVFNAKVNSSGLITWIHKIGGIGVDKGISNFISSDNNFYVTGEFSNTVDFDPSTSSNSESSNGGTDIFVLKLDTSGSLVWVKSFGGTNNEDAKKIKVSPSNKIISVGSFRNTVDFDPSSANQSYTSNGGEDMFIQVLDNNGNFEWAKQIGGIFRDAILGIEVDSKNNLYTSGFFFGTVDFDPGVNTKNLTSQGLADSFIQKLDSNGNLVWVEQFKSNGDVVGSGFSLLNQSNLVLLGSFEQTADFDPSSSNYFKTSFGNRDIFMLSFNVCDTLRDSLKVNRCDSLQSPSGRYTWTSSGIYFDTLTTAYGCDSIVRFDLSIDSTKYDTLKLISCDSSIISPSGNHVWKSSGTYQDTMLTTLGCDSILTVELSLNATSSYFMNQTACGSYIAPSGKEYTSGGLFYDTIPNALGCDSLITIFLSLKNNSTSSQTITKCGSYLSPSNKLYTSSGSYLDTLQNAVGCDSVITTILTIDTINNGVLKTGNQLIANQNNANYQWLDCSNNYARLANDTNQSFSSFYRGSYAVEITDGNCIDTSSCYLLIITSTLTKSENKKEILVYPNPTKDYVIIEQSSSEDTEFILRDINGKVIDRVASSKLKTKILLPKIAGLYFLEYVQRDFSKVVKIIKN